MQKGTVNLTANTAASLDLVTCTRLSLSNAGSAAVYARLNWKTGDAEVSATNFDCFVPAGGVRDLAHLDAVTRLRLVSTANAALGYIAN